MCVSFYPNSGIKEIRPHVVVQLDLWEYNSLSKNVMLVFNPVNAYFHNPANTVFGCAKI